MKPFLAIITHLIIASFVACLAIAVWMLATYRVGGP